MGQEDVLDFLEKKSGFWFNSKEISEGIDRGCNSVRTSLKTLRKNGLVDTCSNGPRRFGNQFSYLYRHKGGMIK